MPSAGTVVWTATCGLIVILLAMTRYTIAKGIDNILKQLEKLWIKMETNEKSSSELKTELREHKAACKERHRHEN